jgi:hypothetical protein
MNGATVLRPEAADLGDLALDLDSPFDVPAFLRRES